MLEPPVPSVPEEKGTARRAFWWEIAAIASPTAVLSLLAAVLHSGQWFSVPLEYRGEDSYLQHLGWRMAPFEALAGAALVAVAAAVIAERGKRVSLWRLPLLWAGALAAGGAAGYAYRVLELALDRPHLPFVVGVLWDFAFFSCFPVLGLLCCAGPPYLVSTRLREKVLKDRAAARNWVIGSLACGTSLVLLVWIYASEQNVNAGTGALLRGEWFGIAAALAARFLSRGKPAAHPATE